MMDANEVPHDDFCIQTSVGQGKCTFSITAYGGEDVMREAEKTYDRFLEAVAPLVASIKASRVNWTRDAAPWFKPIP